MCAPPGPWFTIVSIRDLIVSAHVFMIVLLRLSVPTTYVQAQDLSGISKVYVLLVCLVRQSFHELCVLRVIHILHSFIPSLILPTRNAP